MKKFLPHLLIIVIVIGYCLSLVGSVYACGDGEIDLLDYYLPKQKNITNEIHHYNDSNTESGGLEYFYTYPSTVSNGKEGFYIVKSREPQYFEEFAYDNNYIYHLKDTTWATGANQNVKCEGGGDAFYTLTDGDFGPNGFENFSEDKEGGRIAKRCMSVGETFGPVPLTVIGFNKETCEPCKTPYGGTLQQTMILQYQGPFMFPNGWKSDDLIILQAGAGGEKYYYDKQYGVVGFEGPGLKSFATQQLKESREVEIECDISKSGIILDKLAPSKVKAQMEGEVDFKQTHTSRTPKPGVQAAETSTDNLGLGFEFFDGRLLFQPEGAAAPTFPGLTQLTNQLTHGFQSLLPQDRFNKYKFSTNKKQRQIFTTSYVKSQLSIAGINLPSQSDYVCHNGAPTADEDCAKHTVFAPDSWPKFIFSLTGLSCELLPDNRASQPELCQLFRYQLPTLDWKALTYNFITGPIFSTQNTQDPKHNKPEFHNLLGVLVNSIEEAITEWISRITDTFKIKYQIKVGSELPGGAYAQQGAGIIGAALNPVKTDEEYSKQDQLKTHSLSGDLTYEVQINPKERSTEPLAYDGQLLTRNHACSTLCTAYPEKRINEGMSWVGGDNICPSCKAKDYIVPDPPLPRPSDVPDTCHWDSVGCDYYGCEINDPNPPPGEIFDEYRDRYDPKKPICTVLANVGCGEGQDPVCESTRCNPNELGPKKDYNNQNGLCPQGWTFKNASGDIAEECNEVCHLESFPANPAGGYGPCHYQNGDVCVRNDANGKCGYVCNRVCC